MTTAAISDAFQLAQSLHGQVDVDAVDPFIRAATDVIGSMCGETLTAGKPTRTSVVATACDWTAAIAVTGERIAGVVLYAMDAATARRLASRMTGEFALKLGTMELSALEELANVVTGRASMKLEENGYPCVISPPEVLLGAGSFVAARPWAFMQVPFSLESGTLAISLALRHE